MNTGRLEAFSDGVLAIIITIMVLELKVPHGAELEALRPLWPVLLSYVLSFVYLGIYWNNHHHLIHSVDRVSGAVLWANLHLLFWLSLVPFTTAWMGENRFAAAPVALYGAVLMASGAAYMLLTWALLRVEGCDSRLARAVGRDLKGKLSIGLYVVAVCVAYVLPLLACGIYALVAVMWVVPDPRLERALAERKG